MDRPIGDTKDKIGAFKLLAAIRAIGKHLEQESEDWFANSVRAYSNPIPYGAF
jgi:hypothetical protein